MKKIILCGFWGLVSLAAWADAPNDMSSFLQAAGANPAKAQGASFDFPAYVKGIEVANVKGSKTAVVELGNDKLNGSVISWGTTKMACLMSVAEAGKLKDGQKIQVKGKVQDIKPYQYFNPTIKQTIVGKVITASCSTGPAVEAKATPEPIIPVKQDARSFEVGGLKLGMTVAQVQKALKMTKTPDYGGMWWEEHDEQKGVITCKYEMKFTNDNPDGVLYWLLTDRSDNFSSVNAVKDAAIQKYGAPDDTTYQAPVRPRSTYDSGKDEKAVLYYGRTRKAAAQDRANMSMAISAISATDPTYLNIRIELEDTPMRNKVWQAKKDAEAREAQQRADEQKKRDANIKF